jgi:CRISPR-associated protein Cmr6
MSANLGYLFYNDMYTITDNDIFSNENIIESLYSRTVNSDIDELEYFTSEEQMIYLRTTYPGLVFGTGLAHGVKGDNNDFKIGFSFDHTYGLPVIPASSVKGLLRSAFPGINNDRTTPASIKSVKAKWIQSLISNINEELFFENTYQPLENLNETEIGNIIAIEEEIFEGKKEDSFLGIYKRDIFYDAFISTENAIFLDKDFITPHKNALKDPEPLKFLKVLSNIEFLFQFDVKPGILSVDNKIRLFKKILLTLGIGAKTNVGYGQFE